jgi:hypothetical protein
MKIRNLHRSVCMALMTLLLMFVAATSMAQDAKKETMAKEAEGNIATSWLIWPKAGQSAQFEAAIKKYAAWRKTAGEKFNWQIYQPVVGSDLAHYVIRSGQHTWQDMDTNTAWEKQAKANEEYDKQVGAFTDRAEHYFTESDTKHSHWIDSPDYKYYGVSSYRKVPGTYKERTDALNKIKKAVEDEKWAYPYEISDTIGGDNPLQIVTPMKSYADMADPDPSLMKILAKSLGSDEAAEATMKQFSSTVERSHYSIYVHRADLSTPKN